MYLCREYVRKEVREKVGYRDVSVSKKSIQLVNTFTAPINIWRISRQKVCVGKGEIGGGGGTEECVRKK